MPPPCVNAGKPERADADRDEAPDNTFTELFERTNQKPRTAATATEVPAVRNSAIGGPARAV